MFARPCIVVPVKADPKNLTVAFRIPEWARRHYEELADRERRNLSQVLRLVLEDHAKGICGKNGKSPTVNISMNVRKHRPVVEKIQGRKLPKVRGSRVGSGDMIQPDPSKD